MGTIKIWQRARIIQVIFISARKRSSTHSVRSIAASVWNGAPVDPNVQGRPTMIRGLDRCTDKTVLRWI
jgi:hypothetical protein